MLYAGLCPCVDPVKATRLPAEAGLGIFAGWKPRVTDGKRAYESQRPRATDRVVPRYTRAFRHAGNVTPGVGHLLAAAFS